MVQNSSEHFEPSLEQLRKIAKSKRWKKEEVTDDTKEEVQSKLSAASWKSYSIPPTKSGRKYDYNALLDDLYNESSDEQ